MARKKSLGKKIKPAYYVFCEGDTEEEYVKLLKGHYRIPIEIKSKVEGNSITERKIEAFLETRPKSEKDKTFLLYDIDAPKMLEKLSAIKGVTLLLSNPCIELWFLLHQKTHTGNITTKNCITELSKVWKSYKKGYLDFNCKKVLLEKQKEACKRAVKLSSNNNPSTTVHEFIVILEKAKTK